MPLLSKYSKTNEPHKFVLSLFQRLDLKISNKQVALQNLSISMHLEKYDGSTKTLNLKY